MTAWLAITVATVAKRHHRQQGPIGIEQEERVLDRLRIGQHQRALPEIVQRERRQHQSDPGGLDRLTAEMAEIGVQRFGAGNREKHGAERDEADHAVARAGNARRSYGLNARSTLGIAGNAQ